MWSTNANGNMKSEGGLNSVSKRGRIVIIEDPPHIVGCSEQNQETFMNRLLGFRDPVVIIMSEG